MIESPLVLTAVIAAATALAFLLDHKIAPLSKLGASLLAILFGAALSNLGIVTAASPIYGTVSGSVTSLAIAWLLLAVNLADLKKAGRRMVGAFVLAVTGTALGAFVGALVFAGRFEADTWKLAGTLTGTYSGGGVNFVAVGRGLGLPEVLFAGATAADNAMTAIWLGATLVLPLWLSRFYPAPIPGAGKRTRTEVEHPFFARTPLSTLDLASLIAVGFLLLVAAEWMGSFVPAVPSVLWLTTFALIVGHIGPFKDAPDAMQLGTLALHSSSSSSASTRAST